MTSTSRVPWIWLLVTVAVVSLGLLVGLRLGPAAPPVEIQGVRPLNPLLIDRGLPRGGVETSPTLAVAVPPAPTPTPEPTPEPAVAEERTSEPIELALAQPPGGLSGWVLEEAGKPLAGAQVRLHFEKLVEEGVPGPVLEAVSGQSGLFSFDAVPPGPWTVLAEHSGYSLGTRAGVLVLSGQHAGSVEVVMEPALAVTGLATSPGGQGLAGVRVTLAKRILSVREDSGDVVRFEMPYREATSGEDGRFQFDRAAPGEHTLIGELAGYVPERGATVLDPTGDLSVELVLSPSSSLGGRVRTVEGRPVGGARVEAVDPQNRKAKSETTTAPDGAFLLAGLRGDRTYELTASAAGWAPTGPIEVPAGRLEVVMLLGAGGSVSGRIIRFDDGLPVGGLGVHLRSRPGGVSILRLARSGADGAYRFDYLPTGTYDLRIQDEALTSEPRLGVAVTIPREAGGQDFVVYRGQTISGTVLEDFSGRRISNARVELESAAGPGYLSRSKSQTATDAFGAFKVTNLPFGFYSLEATADGYVRSPGPDARGDVRLFPGSLNEPVTLLLSKGGTITGHVASAQGAPIAGATVQVFNAPGASKAIATDKLTAVTSSGGGFAISGIPLETQVEVQVSGWLPGWAKGKSERIVLTDLMPSAEATVILGAGSPVSVRVEEETGGGVSDAMVGLYHSEFPGDKAPESWSARTGPQGTVLFEQIPVGNVSVGASKEGYVSGGASVAVEPGKAAQVVVALERGRRIWGVVRDDVGALVTEGSVSARGEGDSRGGGSSPIDQEGRFEIGGLGAGLFTLDVRAARVTGTGKHTIRHEVWGVASDSEAPPIAVPMSGGITGAAIEGAGMVPIRGLHVRVEGRYDYRPGRQATFGSGASFSDSEGRFEFASLPPGNYRVFLTAPDFLPVVIEEVVVSSPGMSSVGKTVLDPGGAVVARVISSERGEPVARAVVRLEPGGRTGTSNAEGKVRIAPVEAAVYSLKVTHPEYLEENRDLVQVVQGKEADGGEIRLDPGGRLQGRVMDGRESPVVGAQVKVRPSAGQSERTASTDAGGRVEMRGLEPGGVIITVTAGTGPLQATKSFQETIRSDRASRFEIALVTDGEIRGTMQFAEGASLRQVEVAAYPLEADGQPVTGSRVAGQVTGNRFVISGLVEGNYLVASSGTTSSGRRANWFQVVTVRGPVATSFLAPGSGTLSGRVLLSGSGEPLPGARVRIRGLSFPHSGCGALRDWWEWSTTTDEVGYYEFRGVRGGTYELAAAAPDSGQDQVQILSLARGEKKARQDITVSD